MTENEGTLAETGEKIIDATQTAIIDAAENVSQVLETATEKSVTVEQELPFYTEIEFWIGVAFILTVLILYRYAGSIFKNLLQKHSEKVLSDIEEAIKLRDDAQKLLADYERQTRNLSDETTKILTDVQQNIKKMKATQTAELKKQIQRKQQEASRRMTVATESAQNEINAEAGQMATLLAKKAIERYIDNTDKSKLIDEAIDDLDKIKSPE